jgi:hypothetical protein
MNFEDPLDEVDDPDRARRALQSCMVDRAEANECRN